MKNSIILKLLLVTITLSISCQKERRIIDYQLPKKSDIDAIIKTIIYSDSLHILEKVKSKNPIPFCVNLKKIQINTWDDKINDFPPRIMFNEIVIQDLIGYKNLPSKNFFFSKSDSLYIVFQNKNLVKYKISKSVSDKVLTTTFAEQIKRQKSNENYIYFYSTIPIVSLNVKKAYLELSLKCKGLCGKGYKIYLEKIKDNWTISKYILDWES